MLPQHSIRYQNDRTDLLYPAVPQPPSHCHPLSHNPSLCPPPTATHVPAPEPRREEKQRRAGADEKQLRVGRQVRRVKGEDKVFGGGAGAGGVAVVGWQWWQSTQRIKAVRMVPDRVSWGHY
jgi:hypothetical protein